MTQKLKNYLNCSKWTTSANSSTYKKVHFTVHLHSVNEIRMKSCQLGFYFLRQSLYHHLGLQNLQS